MDLTKMFVQVPNNSAATVESIKTASLSSNKVYFMEKYNQIVAKGTVYGVDPSTGTELETLVSVLGGTKNDDGTVEVDFSHLNYYTSEGTKTIIGAIEAIDAKVKAEVVKLEASKTLDENYEFSGQIKYVAAKDGVAAHIALVDEAGTEKSTINVSDIIGNGVLQSSSYDKTTGILKLTFAQADGNTNVVDVNLADMLDINDVQIDADSQNYMGVNLTGAENSQAVFSIKVSKMDDPTLTGLADAKDVKDYVDGKATDLAITANGDNYVSASVNADVDKKHVIVTTNVQDLTASAGTRGTWSVSDAGDATLNDEIAPSISGVANSLIDGAQGAEAVKTYVDAKVAAEAAERDAKISAAIKALDVTDLTATGGSNVGLVLNEVDGKVTSLVLSESYATVTPVRTTSSADAPKTDASLTVTAGDEAKLVKASDLKAVADYAADKVTEEAHRVNKKIAETIDGLDVAETEVSEAGEGAIKFKYSETAGKVAVKDLSVTYAEHTANNLSTGIVNGTTLNQVLADMWETYVG